MTKKKKNLIITGIVVLCILLYVLAVFAVKDKNESAEEVSLVQSGWTQEMSDKIRTQEPDELTVLCVNFAEYDWIRDLLYGIESIDIELLNESGTDMHSYQPSIEDLARIADCDYFIYTGGISEEWVNDALETAGSKDCTVISLMNVFENSYLYAEYEDNDDEHIWLSERITEYFVEYLCDVFAPRCGYYYDQVYNSCSLYIDELDACYDSLAQKIQAVCDVPVVIADRMPFYYLFEDLGVDCIAAFDGCSAETEASFETVINLANAVDENELKYILVIENSDTGIADTVISTAKGSPEVLELNSLQSVTKEDIDNGIKYTDVLEENLKTILKAVN